MEQSVLLNDVMAADSDPQSAKGKLEKHRAGLNILIRAAVVEAVGMTPSNLADLIRLSVYQIIDTICDRALGYVEKRYERHEVLSPEIAQEMRAAFTNLAHKIKQNFSDEKLQIENHILQHTYMLDHGLYESGYVRFAEHEGIDYTDPAGALQLAEDVEAEEKALDAQLRELASIKAELQDIDRVQPEVERLIEWLQTSLLSGVMESAQSIGELVKELQRFAERF